MMLMNLSQGGPSRQSTMRTHSRGIASAAGTEGPRGSMEMSDSGARGSQARGPEKKCTTPLDL